MDYSNIYYTVVIYPTGLTTTGVNNAPSKTSDSAPQDGDSCVPNKPNAPRPSDAIQTYFKGTVYSGGVNYATLCEMEKTGQVIILRPVNVLNFTNILKGKTKSGSFKILGSAETAQSNTTDIGYQMYTIATSSTKEHGSTNQRIIQIYLSDMKGIPVDYTGKLLSEYTPFYIQENIDVTQPPLPETVQFINFFPYQNSGTNAAQNYDIFTITSYQDFGNGANAFCFSVTFHQYDYSEKDLKEAELVQGVEGLIEAYEILQYVGMAIPVLGEAIMATDIILTLVQFSAYLSQNSTLTGVTAVYPWNILDTLKNLQNMSTGYGGTDNHLLTDVCNKYFGNNGASVAKTIEVTTVILNYFNSISRIDMNKANEELKNATTTYKIGENPDQFSNFVNNVGYGDKGLTSAMQIQNRRDMIEAVEAFESADTKAQDGGVITETELKSRQEVYKLMKNQLNGSIKSIQADSDSIDSQIEAGLYDDKNQVFTQGKTSEEAFSAHTLSKFYKARIDDMLHTNSCVRAMKYAFSIVSWMKDSYVTSIVQFLSPVGGDYQTVIADFSAAIDQHATYFYGVRLPAYDPIALKAQLEESMNETPYGDQLKSLQHYDVALPKAQNAGMTTIVQDRDTQTIIVATPAGIGHVTFNK